MKKIYYLVNIIFLGLAMYFIVAKDLIKIEFNVTQILLLTLLFLVIHIFKFIRIYFLLMEEQVPIREMLKMYVKSTFVSILLPFKTGELFKLYLYGNKINNYLKSLIAIIIDKFLDSVVIIITLLIYMVMCNLNVYPLFVVLLIFILLTILFISGFYGTYYYLNRFFITRTNTKRSVYCLKFLDRVNDIYQDAKNMISGRTMALFSLTMVSWVLEILFVYIVSLYLNISWNFALVIDYLNDSFIGVSNLIFNKSIYICTFLALFILIIIYSKKLITIIKKSRGRL